MNNKEFLDVQNAVIEKVFELENIKRREYFAQYKYMSIFSEYILEQATTSPQLSPIIIIALFNNDSRSPRFEPKRIKECAVILTFVLHKIKKNCIFEAK